MSRIFINPPTLGIIAAQYQSRLDRLGMPCEINKSGKVVTEETLARQAETATALVAGLERIDATFLARSKSLKLIAKYGVGYDNIDIDAARSRGIRITRTLGSNSQAVADCALSAILALLHRLPERHLRTLNGAWDRQFHPALDGLTIAIVGFGRIGSRLASHARHFGWHVLAVDPAKTSVEELDNADALLPLKEALTRADIVSLHYPRLHDRVDIGAREIALMRPGAIFINMARGGLVDEVALAAALRSGHLGGVALDVFAEEPFGNRAQWLGLTNAILTPHIAGSSEAALRTGFEMCLEAIEFAFGLRSEAPRAPFL